MIFPLSRNDLPIGFNFLSQNDLLVVLCKVKFVFLLFGGTSKTTLSSSSPSIHAIIIQKTNKRIGWINQHSLFLFFASLWVISNWKRWSFKRWNRGPNIVLGKYNMPINWKPYNQQLKVHWCSLKMLQKFHFSKFQNSTLKRALKLKVFWTIRVHQTLLTMQIWSLKCYF